MRGGRAVEGEWREDRPGAEKEEFTGRKDTTHETDLERSSIYPTVIMSRRTGHTLEVQEVRREVGE